MGTVHVQYMKFQTYTNNIQNLYIPGNSDEEEVMEAWTFPVEHVLKQLPL